MGEAGGQTCPECGTGQAPAAKYCANCGHSLSGLERTAASSEPLPSGTIVGSYRLLDLLGEGGMGRVYVAEHTKLGRRVAVKMLRAEYSTNPVAVSRFFAEARAVNRISHEHIVEITDFLEKPGGDNCYIMELLRGEDLGRRLLRDRVLPLPTSIEICAQVASALAAVHEAGIVHRDLKPDNIFLAERRGRTNFVKLLDFGVAKLSGGNNQPISTHQTGIGQIIGTPEYMSPEQAGGQAIDHRSDIYALGVVLYELVTGRLPFRAKSFGELVIKHMTVPPKRPSLHADLPHTIPAALDLLILDLLAKDADHRPQAMSDVEPRLLELLEGMDVPVPRSWLPSGSVKIPAMPAPDKDRSGRFPRLRSETDAAAGMAKTVDRAADSVDEPRAQTPVESEPAPRRPRWPIAAAVVVPIAAVIIWLAVREPASASPAPAAPVAAMRPVEPPAPPVVPAEVKIRFTSAPPGAAVRVDGTTKVLGTTPFTASLPRAADHPLAVVFEKTGYDATTEQVALDGDGAVAAALVQTPVATAPVKPPHKSHPTTAVKQKPRPLDRGGTMDVFGDH